MEGGGNLMSDSEQSSTSHSMSMVLDTASFLNTSNRQNQLVMEDIQPSQLERVGEVRRNLDFNRMQQMQTSLFQDDSHQGGAIDTTPTNLSQKARRVVVYDDPLKKGLRTHPQFQSESESQNSFTKSAKSIDLKNRKYGLKRLSTTNVSTTHESQYLNTQEIPQLYHPFAERAMTPWDEWKQTFALGFETLIQFVIIDVLLNGILYYLWRAFEFLLLSPIALIGLLVEFMKIKVFKKCRRQVVNQKNDDQNNQKLDQNDNSQLANIPLIPLVDKSSHSAKAFSSKTFDEDSFLTPNRTKEFFIAIRLTGVLIHVQKCDDTFLGSSMGSESYLNKSLQEDNDDSLSYQSSQRRPRVKIFKKKDVDQFLKYLGTIRAKVWIYESIDEERSLLTKEEAQEVITIFEKESGLELQPILIEKKKDGLINEVVNRIIVESQVTTPKKHKARLLKNLIIIDKISETFRAYPQNTIQVVRRAPTAKPASWQEIIEQLRASKGDDIRNNLPAIIQMQNYYPL